MNTTTYEFKGFTISEYADGDGSIVYCVNSPEFKTRGYATLAGAKGAITKADNARVAKHDKGMETLAAAWKEQDDNGTRHDIRMPAQAVDSADNGVVEHHYMTDNEMDASHDALDRVTIVETRDGVVETHDGTVDVDFVAKVETLVDPAYVPEPVCQVGSPHNTQSPQIKVWNEMLLTANLDANDDNLMALLRYHGLIKSNGQPRIKTHASRNKREGHYAGKSLRIRINGGPIMEPRHIRTKGKTSLKAWNKLIKNASA